MPKETLTLLLLAFPHINALSPLLEAFYNSLGVLIVDLCGGPDVVQEECTQLHRNVVFVKC